MKRTITITITDKQDDREIRSILKKDLGLSTSLIGNIKFKPDGIMVNGQKENVRYKVHLNDTLTIVLDDGESFHDHLIPCEEPIDVVYEDEDLILINKESGVVVHPSPGHYADSLSNRLVNYFNQRNEHYTTRPIGRLDKDTSGLIFFAKNQFAASYLERCRDEGTLSRTYLALVEGHLDNKTGTVDLPLSPVPDVYNRIEVNPDGSPSITDYEVINEYYNEELIPSCYSLVKLRLHTGRTHQIRVHMRALGHPLVGDSFYGSPSSFIDRTALHSYQITGEMPLTHAPFSFTSECPFPHI